MRPFPFIVSAGRSGTTLLQAMLNAHPEMAIPPESHFLIPVAREIGTRAVDPDDVVARWEQRDSFARWGLSGGEVRHAVRHARPATYADAVRALYAFYAASRGKPRYGDKTPKHVLRLGYLARLLPEARFVHLIRDGRDVTCSYVARGLGPRDAVEGALWWKDHVSAGRRDGRALAAGQYLEVRYEDLVSDVEGTLTTVCRFLELRHEPSMLSYREGLDAVLPDRQLQGLHESLRRPVDSGLRDWRSEMRPADVAAFEVIAGGVLSDLGYDRAVAAPSPGMWLLARGRVAGVKARWAARALRRRMGGRGPGQPGREAVAARYPRQRPHTS